MRHEPVRRVGPEAQQVLLHWPGHDDESVGTGQTETRQKRAGRLALVRRDVVADPDDPRTRRTPPHQATDGTVARREERHPVVEHQGVRLPACQSVRHTPPAQRAQRIQKPFRRNARRHPTALLLGRAGEKQARVLAFEIHRQKLVSALAKGVVKSSIEVGNASTVGVRRTYAGNTHPSRPAFSPEPRALRTAAAPSGSL